MWGPDYGDELEYLRVFVNRLRKKIEPDPPKPQFLLTDAWAGYRFHLPQYWLTSEAEIARQRSLTPECDARHGGRNQQQRNLSPRWRLRQAT